MRKLITLLVGVILTANVYGNMSAESAQLFLEELKEAANNKSISDSSDSQMAGGDISSSVVLIGTDESRGSGFLCYLWDIPVIVTNAHVFGQQFGSIIEDGRSHKYKPIAALVSKERDLAIIKVDIPSDRKVFNLAPSLDSVAHKTTANAYGDSLGDRVITLLEGELLGVGPNEIEISAGIVPGNSGGPVVNEKFQIIGVSTYLRILTKDANIFDGTRFGDGKNKNAGIRRFAIRLDKVTPDEFELFDPVRQKQDLDLYQNIAQTNNDFLSEGNSHYGTGIWTLFYSKYSRLNAGFGKKASINFLDKMIREEQSKTCFLSGIFGIAPVELSADEKKYTDYMFERLQTFRRDRFRCDACGGRGYLVDSVLTAPTARFCESCYGLGEAAIPYYNMRTCPVSQYVRFSPYRAGNVAPGMDISLTMRQLSCKLEDANYLNVNGIFHICKIKGNVSYPRAKTTYLTFVAQRLSMITICFDRNRNTWDDLKKELTGKYGTPLVDFGDGGDFGYLLYHRPMGGTLALSSLNVSGPFEGIRLTARHSFLTDLEMRFLEVLGKELFVPPTKEKVQRGFFM